MFIRVADLELRKIQFDEEFRPGDIDLGPELRQTGDLRANGHAELIREHHSQRVTVPSIRLVGTLRGEFEANCARCIEPVPQRVDTQFDLLYRPLGTDRRGDEVSISEAETEIGYYEGEGMELADSVREQVLLALPVKVVCRPDCKGICPECGKNLNEVECNCSTKVVDPRWDVLKDLKKDLQ